MLNLRCHLACIGVADEKDGEMKLFCVYVDSIYIVDTYIAFVFGCVAAQHTHIHH